MVIGEYLYMQVQLRKFLCKKKKMCIMSQTLKRPWQINKIGYKALLAKEESEYLPAHAAKTNTYVLL